MIYTVESNFSDPGREVEWNAWYETYLTQLVSLPGLTTAQRFRALTPGTPAWAYLAIYSVASLAVFASEAYRGIGGGGQASRRGFLPNPPRGYIPEILRTKRTWEYPRWPKSK